MLKRIVHFYIDGFRSMTLGRTLWALILIKLFIMFAIVKPFVSPNFLATQFDNDAQRAEHVLSNLSQRPAGGSSTSP